MSRYINGCLLYDVTLSLVGPIIIHVGKGEQLKVLAVKSIIYTHHPIVPNLAKKETLDLGTILRKSFALGIYVGNICAFQYICTLHQTWPTYVEY